MGSTKHVSIRIPEEILAWVDQQAEYLRWSRNATLNACIEFGLVDLEKERGGPKSGGGTGADSENKSEESQKKSGESARENRQSGIKGGKSGKKGAGVSAPETKERDSVTWFPHSKCPHGYTNSFACEREMGGCSR